MSHKPKVDPDYMRKIMDAFDQWDCTDTVDLFLLILQETGEDVNEVAADMLICSRNKGRANYWGKEERREE